MARHDDSLALLFDPVVLFLEVCRACDMARLFLREDLYIVLQLLDRHIRIGRLLLLRLDNFVQIA